MLGHFYVVADDIAEIYLNGEKIHHAKLGLSKSNEITVMKDDVLVIDLKNNGGPKNFMLIFLTTDRKTIVNFKNNDYRILPAFGKKNLQKEDVDAYRKFAVDLRKKPRSDIGIKHKSETVWGEANQCVLGAVIDSGMIESYSE